MAYEQLKLDNQLCFRLYAASRFIQQAYRPYLEEMGVTYPQYLVLMVLWEEICLPVNEIAKRLTLETNTVTPLIQRMERDGLVLRTKGEIDSRQIFISLTEKAKALEEKSARIPACLIQMMCENGVGDTTIEDIIPMLDKLINSLRKEK